MLIEYSDEIINNMRCLYKSLSEKDRRRYAAIEAKKLGHGGVVYISILFGCDEKTISKGLVELNNDMSQSRIRRPGGGLMHPLVFALSWCNKYYFLLKLFALDEAQNMLGRLIVH